MDVKNIFHDSQISPSIGKLDILTTRMMTFNRS